MALKNLYRLPDPNLAYPWKWHWLMLAPLLLITCAIGVLYGFWGEAPYLWFQAARRSCPVATELLRAVSSHTSMALYLCYTAIFALSLFTKRRTQTLFVLRFALGSLLFGVVATHMLKSGLGMPRPGHEWPPQPFTLSHAYCSFPSGHTVAVVTAALPLAFWLGNRKGYIILSLLVMAVGFSRLWLGSHHPVDIFGGIFVGSAAVWYIICHPAFIGRPEGKATKSRIPACRDPAHTRRQGGLSVHSRPGGNG